mmetsp:Transcript_10414/g.63611  ORF Transcript_10414/g.63611 Transcript_10414/m.63611 type:complete len:109 (-) Transcript_10414:1332-1658(-)
MSKLAWLLEDTMLCTALFARILTHWVMLHNTACMWDGCCAVAYAAELSSYCEPGMSFEVHSSKTGDEVLTRWRFPRHSPKSQAKACACQSSLPRHKLMGWFFSACTLG